MQPILDRDERSIGYLMADSPGVAAGAPLRANNAPVVAVRLLLPRQVKQRLADRKPKEDEPRPRRGRFCRCPGTNHHHPWSQCRRTPGRSARQRYAPSPKSGRAPASLKPKTPDWCERQEPDGLRQPASPFPQEGLDPALCRPCALGKSNHVVLVDSAR